VVCSLLPSSLIWDSGLDLQQTRTMQQTHRGTTVGVFAPFAGMFARSFGLQVAALGHWTEQSTHKVAHIALACIKGERIRREYFAGGDAPDSGGPCTMMRAPCRVDMSTVSWLTMAK